ncbi:MAG: hypothetical protein WAO22_04210 [bacterium]|jgi:stage III sporulation protein AG|nr:hypothetical protein [Bacillota bacterium]
MTDKDTWSLKTKPRKHMSWQWLKIDRYTLVKLGLLAGLGLILLIAGQLVKGPAQDRPSSSPSPGSTVASASKQIGSVSYQETLELQLANTLSQVRGAGQVLVHLSLEGGNRVTYATNRQEEVRSTEEKAPAGSTVRVSEEKRTEAQLVMAREGNAEYPVVVDEFLPTVRGVLVIAEGAKNPFIKEELSQAVQVVLGLPAHKVKVLERVD